MTKIILCGCLGRMGTAVHDLVAQTDGMEIVAGVDVIVRPAPYPMYTNIADCDIAADVVIDFLPPTAVEETLKLVDYCVRKHLADCLHYGIALSCRKSDCRGQQAYCYFAICQFVAGA